MAMRHMTPEERLKYCQGIVEAQQSSGLTVQQWCEREGISKARFYRYRRYVIGAAQCKPEAESEENIEGVPASSEHRREITVSAGGVKIVLSEDSDWNVVYSVVQALSDRC